MAWIILYATSVFVYYAIDCGRVEKATRNLNGYSIVPIYKPKYFKMLLEALVWPLYLVFTILEKLGGI